jgi:PAS domain S-box-containing protein
LAASNLVAVAVATAVVSDLEHDVAIVAIMFNAIVSVVLLTAAVFRNRLEFDRRADLVARQELQDSILEGTFSGVAIVRDGEVSEANHAFAQLFHVAPDQLTGTPLRIYFGSASDERVADLETSTGPAIELSISRPDGSSFDAEVIARRTPDGTARVVAIRDISERKRNDRALVRAQRMESVGRVAAGLAHDTNNELFVIAAHSEAVRADLKRAGLATGGVEQIRDASDRIAVLIGRVLQFGRDDESAPEPVDLGVVIEENGPMWRQVLGAEVNLRLEARKPCVALIDRARVEQLLLNLVLNARDALDGAGEVWVASQLQTVDDSTTAAPAELAPGRYHLVTVTDNGHGISLDDRHLVFDPFFTTKDHDHGTGLGLYTSREIARSAGGDLSVVSEGGRTTFAFHVPEHISSEGRS